MWEWASFLVVLGALGAAVFTALQMRLGQRDLFEKASDLLAQVQEGHKQQQAHWERLVNRWSHLKIAESAGKDARTVQNVVRTMAQVPKEASPVPAVQNQSTASAALEELEKERQARRLAEEKSRSLDDALRESQALSNGYDRENPREDALDRPVRRH